MWWGKGLQFMPKASSTVVPFTTICVNLLLHLNQMHLLIYKIYNTR